ncbi:MAG TPA: hypothetical protein VIS99_07380 [Terrimicrobiaceae bacterium]
MTGSPPDPLAHRGQDDVGANGVTVDVVFAHVLATVIYQRMVDVYKVKGLRPDFLEPTTLVNVRLEGSVSHRLLARSSHRSITI